MSDEGQVMSGERFAQRSLSGGMMSGEFYGSGSYVPVYG